MEAAKSDWPKSSTKVLGHAAKSRSTELARLGELSSSNTQAQLLSSITTLPSLPLPRITSTTMSAPSGQGPHPLRPYYQPSDEPTIYASTSSSSSTRVPRSQPSSSTGSQPSVPSATVTIPRRPNRYVNDNDDALSALELGSSITEMTKAGLLGLLLQYSSTCVAMPFEVAKLLLQVQWVPKDEVWNSFVASIAQDLPKASKAPARRSLRQESDEDEEDDDDLDMAPEAQEWRREPRFHDEDFADEDDEDSMTDEEVSCRQAAPPLRPAASHLLPPFPLTALLTIRRRSLFPRRLRSRQASPLFLSPQRSSTTSSEGCSWLPRTPVGARRWGGRLSARVRHASRRTRRRMGDDEGHRARKGGVAWSLEG